MNPLIWEQAYHFIILFYGGLTVGILHWACRAFQKRWKPRPGAAFVQDLLFWVLAAILTSAFLYYCAYGKVTLHGILAFGLGIVLWQLVFGEKLYSLFLQLYGIIKRIIFSQGGGGDAAKEKKQSFRKRRGFKH